jgi:hypothetical protein
MKTLFTFCISVLTLTAFAQVPTNFGTDAEDGILYQEYNLIDHGAVSSVRFQAQNAIPAGDAEWSFFTGNYDPTWRPYTADDTLSGFNSIIDPSVESASARYNSGLGIGEPGRLPEIQAGYFYTAIIENGTGNNSMSIVETDFAPVAIDTIIISPENPLFQDDITITVELDGAMMLSPGEHVFVRASLDGYLSSFFFEISNFSNGVGTGVIPGGTIPYSTVVSYYGLVTNQSTPDPTTVDYFTLFFENLGGLNYEFETFDVTVGIEDVAEQYGIIVRENVIEVRNTEDVQSIELVSLDGRVITTVAANGSGAASINTTELSAGTYIINLISATERASAKVFVQ